MAQIVTPTNTIPTITTLVDEASASTTYIGLAKLGTTTATAAWQIRRVDKSGTVTSILYANGSRRYNQVWDDRVSLSYSN